MRDEEERNRRSEMKYQNVVGSTTTTPGGTPSGSGIRADKIEGNYKPNSEE